MTQYTQSSKNPLATHKPCNQKKNATNNRGHGGPNGGHTNGNGECNNSTRVNYIEGISGRSEDDSFKQEGSDADDDTYDKDYSPSFNHSTCKNASHFSTSLLCMEKSIAFCLIMEAPMILFQNL